MDRAERESSRPGPPESAVGPQGHPPRCRPGWWGCGAPRLFEAVGSCHTFDPFESRAAAYPFQLPLSPGCLPRGFANECNFTATKGTRRTESSRGKTALSFFFPSRMFSGATVFSHRRKLTWVPIEPRPGSFPGRFRITHLPRHLLAFESSTS